jgi:hypothetical protein
MPLRIVDETIFAGRRSLDYADMLIIEKHVEVA